MEAKLNSLREQARRNKKEIKLSDIFFQALYVTVLLFQPLTTKFLINWSERNLRFAWEWHGPYGHLGIVWS